MRETVIPVNFHKTGVFTQTTHKTHFKEGPSPINESFLLMASMNLTKFVSMPSSLLSNNLSIIKFVKNCALSQNEKIVPQNIVRHKIYHKVLQHFGCF